MKFYLALILTAVLIASGCAEKSSTDSPDEVTSNPPEDPVDSNNSENTSSQDEGNQTIITYTDSGFEPGTITVEQGTTITWQSEASRRMWIGSNRHPTHTQYDGSSTGEHCENREPVSSSVFDQCSSGQTFSFTFKQTGEWNYHNHRYSTHTGTVIVE